MKKDLKKNIGMSDVHSDAPDCVYTDKNSGSSSETEQDISYPCYRKELHIKVTGNKAEANMEEQQHSHCICVFRWKSYRTEDRRGNDHSESWKEKL